MTSLGKTPVPLSEVAFVQADHPAAVLDNLEAEPGTQLALFLIPSEPRRPRVIDSQRYNAVTTDIGKGGDPILGAVVGPQVEVDLLQSSGTVQTSGNTVAGRRKREFSAKPCG